jgi:hypothetical protein
MRHDIPEEPARQDKTWAPLLCLDGPTKNMEASSLAQKAHAHEMHEKSGSISKTYELPRPVRGDMKKERITKPEWGRTTPVRLRREGS